MVKFGHFCFVWGKSENYLVLGSYCSLLSQSWWKHATKWVNEVNWASKGKVILWPWPKVTQISKLEHVFLRNSGALETKVHMKAYWRLGMKIYTNELGHMTKIATMPIYCKNLLNSSPLEPMTRWPWNLVCSIKNQSTIKLVQRMTLGWPWFFLRQGQIWENANTKDFMESLKILAY